MNNYLFEKIHTQSLNLPTCEKKLLVKDLLYSIVKYNHDDVTNEFIQTISCPHCNSTNKVKNGILKNRQRYLCKSCNKSYNQFTKTPISYSKKDISLWENYIKLLFSCDPLRTVAKKLNISLSTAFYWRHKLLDALRENSVTDSKLTDSVKILEHYTRESFKGSSIPKERTSYKNGEKRGLKFDRKTDVCILIAMDKKNIPLVEMACLDKPKDDTLENILDNKITSGSAIITDKWIPYKRLAAKNNLIYAPYLNKFHKSRKYHAKEIDLISNNIRKFLGDFQGVATKYLENYLSLFKLLHYFSARLDLDLHTAEKIRIRDYKFREPIYR